MATSGLQIETLTKGTGPKPKTGDIVKVHYTGWLLDCCVLAGDGRSIM